MNIILPILISILFLIIFIIIIGNIIFFIKTKNKSKLLTDATSFIDENSNTDIDVCDTNNTITKTVNKTIMNLNDNIDNKIQKQIDKKMDKLFISKQNIFMENPNAQPEVSYSRIITSKNNLLTKADWGPELSTRAVYCPGNCYNKNRITENLQLKPTILPKYMPNIMTAENYYKVNILGKNLPIIGHYVNPIEDSTSLGSTMGQNHKELTSFANPFSNDKILSQNTKGLNLDYNKIM